MEYNMPEFYKKVGYRVRTLRTERHLSREEFAVMIDICTKYFYIVIPIAVTAKTQRR